MSTVALCADLQRRCSALGADLKANAIKVWAHRTKICGGAALASQYAIDHQDKLNLFLAAWFVHYALAFFGGLTFMIGCYNTYHDWIKRTP